MADIVLAAYSGQAWLVRGEQYIDDLLGNTLPPDVSTEVITCESKSAVDALWQQWNDDGDAIMWLIHPAIVDRTRRMSGQGGAIAVTFAPWSAALDAAALRAAQDAADVVAAKPAAALVLVHYLAADAAPMAAGLADLRCGLLEQHLATLGIKATERDSKPPTTPEQTDRIDLIVRA